MVDGTDTIIARYLVAQLGADGAKAHCDELVREKRASGDAVSLKNWQGIAAALENLGDQAEAVD